jgi:hypothetical protein
MYYILYLFLDNVNSKCFGCYLHPSSGVQLQRTAIAFVSGKQVSVLSGVEVILYGFVCTRFSKCRVMFMCRCVFLDLFWYCVVMMSGFFTYSFCAIFVNYGLVCYCIQQVLVWNSCTLKHGQLQPGEGSFCKVCTGFRVVVVTFGLWLVGITCPSGITPLHLKNKY